MLVLSWMVCNVRLSTNSGCSSGNKGGSVSKTTSRNSCLSDSAIGLAVHCYITPLGRVAGVGGHWECILPVFQCLN